VNNRGQAFSAYRLLIGAIMGLAIMVMIVATIHFFEQKSTDIDWRIFIDGFESASELKDGSVIVEKSLSLGVGQSVNSRGLSELVAMGEQCISFDANERLGFKLGENSKSVYSANPVSVDVYYRCALQQLDSDCPEECIQCCLISFGKEIESLES